MKSKSSKQHCPALFIMHKNAEDVCNRLNQTLVDCFMFYSRYEKSDGSAIL